MLIESIYDESFRNYGRVWADVPAAFTEPVVHALAEHAPCPEDGTKYEASAAALEELEVAPALKGLLFEDRYSNHGRGRARVRSLGSFWPLRLLYRGDGRRRHDYRDGGHRQPAA